MNVRFIKTPEKREIVEKLNEQFGIEDIPYLLVESGKEKIRAFSGSLSKDEISALGKVAQIESIGLYLIRKDHDLRLSFDGLHILKDGITKGIIDINDQQYEMWIRGYDLPFNGEKGIYVVRYKTDLLGCAKSTGELLINHVPKERRLRTQLKN